MRRLVALLIQGGALAQRRLRLSRRASMEPVARAGTSHPGPPCPAAYLQAATDRSPEFKVAAGVFGYEVPYVG